MKKLEDEYEDLELIEMDKMFKPKSKIISRSNTQAEHIWPLDYSIDSFEQSEELFKLLSTVSSNDMVRLYINSYGGRIDVADRIVSLILEAQERGVFVLADIGFTCCSAATFIALNCSDITLSPFSNFMIHNWQSGGSYGTADVVFRDADFNKKQSEAFMREVYKGFLSEEELEDVIKHPRDLNFNAIEVAKRWESMKEVEEGEPEQKITLEALIKEKIEAALSEREKPPIKAVTKKPKKLTK